MTAKNMPYKNGFGPFAGEVYRVPMSYPFRETAGIKGEDAAARAIDQLEKQVGAENLACVVDRADPRRGRLRRARPTGFLPALAAWCREQRRAVRRRRDPVRLLPHRRLVRLRPRGRRPRPDHHGQGHRRRPAARRASPAAPRSWTPCTSAASAARTAATRSPAPPRSGAIEEMRTHDLRGPGPRDRALIRRPARRARRRPPGDRRHPRPRRDDGDRAAARPGTHEPDAARAAARSRRTATRSGVVVLTCGTWGNVFRFLPPLSISDELLEEAFDVVAEAFAATA